MILENDDTRLKMGRFGAERAKEFILESHIEGIIGAFE
jgi:hypothetical protein